MKSERNKRLKPKRMTREMAMSFMYNAKCSFKSCKEIAYYTTGFDEILSLPIETKATVKLCLNHKDVISKDFADVKFDKIPFIEGVHAKVTCQRCGNSWAPEGF